MLLFKKYIVQLLQYNIKYTVTARHAEYVIVDKDPCVFDPYACVSASVHRRVWRFSLRFFAMRFVAKRYILQQKCLKGQIGTCLLGTRWCNL